MRIENLEKIKGWTPPGNPSTQPIVFDIDNNAYDYQFDIRYEGLSYQMVLSKYENENGRYDLSIRRKDQYAFNKTCLDKNIIRDMREFYDVFHTMLYRISKSQFHKYY